MFIYTTRSTIPYAVIGSIHYAELTDMAWSNDDRLIISSRDGFITLINFENKELGDRLSYENIGEIQPVIQPLFHWMISYRDLSKTVSEAP